jgi:hypothetical protein
MPHSHKFIIPHYSLKFSLFIKIKVNQLQPIRRKKETKQSKIYLKSFKLDDLGLMEHNYERLQRRLPTEFDRTTGKLKLQNKKISVLGRMLVRYIDDSYSDDGY